MIYPLPKAVMADVYEGHVSTILSDKVSIPIACDRCDCETEYSIQTLKTLPSISCGHCGHTRQFSQAEFEVVKQFLTLAGFHFSN